MTKRDKFMNEAIAEIDQILVNKRNKFMNLIEKAWAEGKKEAELEQTEKIGNDILDLVKAKLIYPPAEKMKTFYANNWAHVDTAIDIPEACRNCPNHPTNGGTGICHCTLGGQKITC